MKPEIRHYYGKTAKDPSKTTSISRGKTEGESAHYGETLTETPRAIRGTYPRYRATLVPGLQAQNGGRLSNHRDGVTVCLRG
ncbi:Hypothetical predicted protein [Pelobates cultripes]|uniref:Uncharacterized protein n=1 Tax=Pelobates cultripes TaxID=61616 RepID=A0AAD1VXS2_PELCU|nr:Hypothetical predicted protein [Pelobates cultripes]